MPRRCSGIMVCLSRDNAALVGFHSFVFQVLQTDAPTSAGFAAGFAAASCWHGLADLKDASSLTRDCEYMHLCKFCRFNNIVMSEDRFLHN